MESLAVGECPIHPKELMLSLQGPLQLSCGGNLGKVMNNSFSVLATCEMVIAVPVSQGGCENSMRDFHSQLSPVSWLCYDFKWMNGI